MAGVRQVNGRGLMYGLRVVATLGVLIAARVATGIIDPLWILHVPVEKSVFRIATTILHYTLVRCCLTHRHRAGLW